MPRLESGQTVGFTSSADVPQLPKAIRCPQQPQCDSFKAGSGCDHAMAKADMLQWLETLRRHRISIESAPRRSANAKRMPTADELDEF